MSLTAAQFKAWAAKDSATRTVLAHFKNRIEVAESPEISIEYWSDQEYFDDTYQNPYVDCIRSGATYSRSLSGDRLGMFSSSVGSLTLDNANGEFDYLLNLACDGSEIEFYLGDQSWPFDDFKLMFVALIVRVEAGPFDQITITLRDSGLLLSKSIGGQVLIGGTGPNSDQYRPFNFGYVRQVKCKVIDPIALIYAYSDFGNGGTTFCCDVQDRGLSVSFVDNFDGTFTLLTSPDGDITAHVMAPCSDSVAVDLSGRRRISHAFKEVVAIRCDFEDLGLYGYAGPTFTIDDDQDYFVGFSLEEARNVNEILNTITDTGHCFWAITRLGLFVFGRLRPDDIASFGLTAVAIEEDDIDDASWQVNHVDPGYYKYQAYMDKNWSIPSTLADSLDLDPDQRARIVRPGLFKMQEDAVGTAYADAPELYDLTMAVSPAIDTILSGGPDSDLLIAGGDDDIDKDILTQWLEDRRFMTLPWLEILSFQVGIEFYELELGSVISLRMDRYGLESGELLQVIGIDLQLTSAKMQIKAIRRRRATEYPFGWVRVTAGPDDEIESTNDLDYEFAVNTDPPPTSDPPLPPPVGGRPPITGMPWWPGTIVPPRLGFIPWGVGGGGSPSPFVNRIYDSGDFGDLLDGNGDIVAADAINTATDRIKMSKDGAYLLVGEPAHDAGSGNTGQVLLYKRTSTAMSWSLLETFVPLAGSFVNWGAAVDMTDDDGSGQFKIAVVGLDGLFTYFLPTGVDTWDTGTETTVANAFSKNVKFSPQGDWLFVNDGDDVKPLAWNGSAYVGATPSYLTASFGGAPTVQHFVSQHFDRVVVYLLWDGGTKQYVDIWYDAGGGVLTYLESIDIGLGDGFSGSNAVGGQYDGGDKLAVSEDTRVLVVGNSSVYRGSNFVGGFYVYQALGDYSVAFVSRQSYVQSALITGPHNEDNSGFGKSLALSRDGSFLVMGSNYYPNSAPDSVGYVIARNKTQELTGELVATNGSSGSNWFVMVNPHPAEQDFGWGSGITMNYNGSSVAITGEDGNDASLLQVRVYELDLEDLLMDRFAAAIALSATAVTDEELGPYSILAAGVEPLEYAAIGSDSLTRSLWFKITPTVDSRFQIDTYLSAVLMADIADVFDTFDDAQAYVDTTISVGQATAADAFTAEAGGENDDTIETVSSGPPEQDTLSKLDAPILLLAGITYYIQVALYSGSDAPYLKIRYTLVDAEYVFDDQFGGTDPLESHTPNVGAGWLDSPAFGETITNFETVGGVCRVEDGVGSPIRGNAIPDYTSGSNDYEAKAHGVRIPSVVSGNPSIIVACRWIEGSADGYIAEALRLDDNTINVSLYQYSGSSITGDDANVAVNEAVPFSLSITVVGNALVVKVDDVDIGIGETATGSPLTTGTPLLYMKNNGTGDPTSIDCSRFTVKEL